MTRKFLFLAAVATMLSFTACNKDNNLDDQNGNGTAKEGYLSINISSAQTRTTPGSDGVQDGEGDENLINNVTVVFTDDLGMVQYVKTPDMASASVTEKFKVELGTYKLYVLVNNPATNVFNAGDNIERVIEVATAEDAEKGFMNGSFFMVNERHNAGAEAAVDVTIDATNTEDNPYKATVNVDRVAVKIVDNTASPDFTVAGVNWLPDNVQTLHVEGFVMLNINKNFNMIQQWGDLNLNGITPLSEDVLQTPLYPGVPELVQEQYFRNISEYTELVKTAGTITEIIDLTRGSDIFTTDVKYATENRPTIIEQALQHTAGQGETTGVIYKVTVRDGVSTVPTFYGYNNTYTYNLADFVTAGYFESDELDGLTVSQLRGVGVKVYEDGVMYYTHFIKDPNINYQYEGKNYYSVFRNSIYQLTINGFNKIGDDVPGGGTVDPSEPGEPGNPPIDRDEAYIDVTITINPWVLNIIGIDF